MTGKRMRRGLTPTADIVAAPAFHNIWCSHVSRTTPLCSGMQAMSTSHHATISAHAQRELVNHRLPNHQQLAQSVVHRDHYKAAVAFPVRVHAASLGHLEAPCDHLCMWLEHLARWHG